MATVEEPQEGIFKDDALEEKLYEEMRNSFMAAVEGEDLHPSVERAILLLYLGEIQQNAVAETFRDKMQKSDGRNIVKVALTDWKKNSSEALKTFSTKNKARKIDGKRFRDYWE